VGRSGFLSIERCVCFRDQLQDVLALLFAAPHTARTHLLHAASRQFVEGMCSTGGTNQRHRVRTRFSDDRLWLVYATLDTSPPPAIATCSTRASFLDGRRLEPGEHDAYERPTISRSARALRALRASRGDQSGDWTHGLPLKGTATERRDETWWAP